MTSIFVAKLDFGIGNEDLKQAFARFGTVNKATVAMDRETGKSRGFGFVEMANAEEAQAAIQALDGSLLNGRPIAVKEAEQRGDSRPSRDNSTRNQQRPDRDHAPRPDRNAASTGEYRPKADSSTASLPLPKVAVAGGPTKLSSPTFGSSEGRSRFFLGLLDALDAEWFLPDRRPPGLEVTLGTSAALACCLGTTAAAGTIAAAAGTTAAAPACCCRTAPSLAIGCVGKQNA
jgi:RNA recognition motif-containing protein